MLRKVQKLKTEPYTYANVVNPIPNPNHNYTPLHRVNYKCITTPLAFRPTSLGTP